jgi:uncharacterized protein Yka (UPF0111/DUF47 family)
MKNKEKIEKTLYQYLTLSSRYDKAMDKAMNVGDLLEKKKEQLTNSIEKEFPDLGDEVLVIAGKALSIKKQWPHDPSVVIKDLI